MENTSGIIPVEYKVLIKPEKVEDKTKGGLYLPDTTKERQQAAQTFGIFIAAGGNAFEEINPPLPQPGDRVCYAKYAGSTVKGVDGEEYQIINDKDVAGIIYDEVNYE